MAGVNFFNSKECSWKDMTVFFNGAKIAKIRGLRYKPTMDKDLLHAGGDKPISIQSGNRTYEGSITLLKGALDDINRAAIAAGGADVLDISFDIVAVYKGQGARTMKTDTLVNVEIKEYEYGWDQGAKHMEVTLPIIFMELLQA